MKYFKRYYAHFFLLGLVLFALTGAYYSTPMVLDFEYEFKTSVQKAPTKPFKPILPLDKAILDI
ncbi:MAG: hypothetical protein IAE90_10400 [Ignavibacteria bacterium]|nr:hypothetical protein [Ignavibacteria bacterium]